MRVPDFGRYALSSCIAGALLAGCGGSQPPLGAMRQSGAIVTRAAHGGSWMRQKATTGDLVYITGGCGGTCVVSYPDGNIVGHLDDGDGLNAGACADSQGNVYISNNNESHSEVVEYPHAGATPIATFDLPGKDAAGCSVDSTTGNLAVMFEGGVYGVAIFTPASQSPQLYPAPVDGFSCAYDPSGNLFVGGLGDGTNAALAELPKGTSTFSQLTISKTIEGAGQVQWYGNYLSYSSTFGGDPFIYRLKISGTGAEVVKTTRLVHEKWLWYPWIYQNKILAPYTRHGVSARALGIWDYPRGGKIVEKFTGFGAASLQSVTVSVATK
ncbi:MAG: hypothetical protein WCB99_06525 [Candidatus Cybelea sp.]